MAVSVKLVDNTEPVLKAFKAQKAAALEECGLTGERYAKGECPVDTGNLRNSLTHGELDSDTEQIGTAVEYAIYVELGTGKYATGGGGRQTPWVYTDSKGKTHLTHGSRAQPYLKPAIVDHVNEYRQIITENLKS